MQFYINPVKLLGVLNINNGSIIHVTPAHKVIQRPAFQKLVKAYGIAP